MKTTTANQHEHKSSCTNNYVQYKKEKLKFESSKADSKLNDNPKYPEFQCQFHSRMEKAHYCPIFRCYFKEDINRWTNTGQDISHQLKNVSSDRKIVQKGDAGKERLDHAVNTLIKLSSSPSRMAPHHTQTLKPAHAKNHFIHHHPSKLINMSSMPSNQQLQTKSVAAAYHEDGDGVSKMRTHVPTITSLKTFLSNNTAANVTPIIISGNSFTSMPVTLKPFTTTTTTVFATNATTSNIITDQYISQTTQPTQHTLAATPATLVDSVGLPLLTIFTATTTTTTTTTTDAAVSVSNPDKIGMPNYAIDSESATSPIMTQHEQASPVAVVETAK